MMIGDKVPDGDEHWANFLDLLKITDLLLAPELTEDDVSYMAVMITDHHQQFKHLYPHASVTPKMHYLLHMARIILKYVTTRIQSKSIIPPFAMTLIVTNVKFQVWAIETFMDNAF